MRNRLLILICLFSLVNLPRGFAQNDLSSQINTPALQKYIDLAKVYYPRRQMFKANELSAKAKIGVAAAGYLESLNLSYFYRPDNATIINANNPYSINGFQLGVYLNLGTFVRTPALIKQAKQAHLATVAETNEYDIVLATEVKEKYYDYLRWFSDLKIKSEAYNDSKAASDGLRYKFEKGEVTLDTYSKAKALTTQAASDKLMAELNMLKAKEGLEALIGQKLEDVK
jgi:outer membrane protein TolC